MPLVAGGSALGVIAVHDKLGGDARFSDEDLRLVEIFGARAAVAVSLSERVARDTVRRVVDAQESERRRLALELHDETGQALTSILLGVSSIRAADRRGGGTCRSGCPKPGGTGSPRRTRARRRAPRPAALDDFGLVSALERLGETFSERSGIETVVQADVKERLSPEVEITLYRVVQEALTNVVKHSGAKHVSIVISNREGRVAATIDDDGRGFESAEVREDALGLLGMRERLALVGGTLEVESSAGSGTTIAAQVPAPASL